MEVIHGDPEIFCDLKSAEDYLFRDLHDMWKFYYQSATPCRYFEQEHMPLSVLTEFETLRKRLDHWKRAFLLFEISYGVGFSKLDAEHASLLHIHHSTGTVLLIGEMNPQETAYDLFDNEFQSIVARSDQLLQNRLATPWAETFSMEMGIIQPLYITALKCRVHQIRTAAIKLLSSVPRPEGIWNGQVMARIAEQVMIIEEEGIDLESSGSERLPAFRRVHSVSLDINQKARTASYFCTLRRMDGNGEWDERSGTVTW